MKTSLFTRLVPAFALASLLATGACSSPVAMDDDGGFAECDPESPEYDPEQCGGGDTWVVGSGN